MGEGDDLVGCSDGLRWMLGGVVNSGADDWMLIIITKAQMAIAMSNKIAIEMKETQQSQSIESNFL
jgi:hypothetical protein